MSDAQRWAGIYRVIEDDIDVGTEAWTREVSVNGVRLTSVINRTDERGEFEEEVDITLDRQWRPLTLNVERTTADGERRYVGRRVGDAWISQVFRETGPMRTTTLPFGDDTHVDYLTAHTNGVTIHRLDLAPQTGQEIEVVFIDPIAFTPSIVRQHYLRLADPEPFEIAGEMATREYQYRGASGVEYLIWTDDSGIILRYEDLFEAIQFNRASS
jgi:hypothetical protein